MSIAIAAITITIDMIFIILLHSHSFIYANLRFFKLIINYSFNIPLRISIANWHSFFLQKKNDFLSIVFAIS